MTTYKTYDPENNPVTFNSLRDLRTSLDLTKEEVQRIANSNGTATTDNGTKIIVYRD